MALSLLTYLIKVLKTAQLTDTLSVDTQHNGNQV